MNSSIAGTVVLYGPFFARSGFGILARGWAMALHQAGVKVRIVPVDCNDPNAAGDLDDCDLYRLQSLKYTPLTAPVTAIFAYVPTYVWPKVQLPEPCRRILLTTFDSSANAATPPSRLTFIGNQMDQVWLANCTEEAAWIRGGLNADKVHSFNWPHEWIDNAQLGAPVVRTRQSGEAFRFLHVSLFLPRRRLDVLIRAFFEEFKKENDAELYLKLSYPTWHPMPGKPKKDLHALIERLQKETGSRAKVVVDESLGSRLELARLIDRCDAYVSPDTTHTAPVTEAIMRERLVIITDGWGVELPPQCLVVPNLAGRVAITPEMAEYMPHQRGASFPALDAGSMRAALRKAFSVSAAERQQLVSAATQFMRERYSYAATAPAAIAAIKKCWSVAAGRMPAVEPGLQPGGKSVDYFSGVQISDAQPGHEPGKDAFHRVPFISGKLRDAVELVPTQCGERVVNNSNGVQKPDAGPGGRMPSSTADGTPATTTTKLLNLNWSGLQLFYGKIPTANREICLELLRRGHRLSLLPGNGPFHIEELDLNASPKYRHLARKFYEQLPARADFSVSSRWHPVFNEQPGARQIMVNTWWHGAIPTDWIRPIAESVSEVWVPSRFVRDNFLRGGVAEEQLQVIPFGVNPDLFHPGLAPCPLQTKKRFKFLFVGETTQRKGFDLVLNAYLKLFTNRDDVCLVIKDVDCEDYYGRLAGKAVVQKCRANPRAPEIEYIPEMRAEEDLAALYAACDCFVQPHRAASSGQSVMEAKACGLPIITTEFGGVLDFCSRDNALLVPAREVRQRSGKVGHWKVSGEQVHAEPDQAALLQRMEQVYQNSSAAKQRAAQAGENIRADFSWAKTVDRIEERFQKLQSVPENKLPRAVSTKPVPGSTEPKADGPTLVLFAPFYNRSGYGVAARSLVVALSGAGLRIRTVPVDNVEEGIDDCDMPWLRSLEKTPVTSPVVAIFFHVPGPPWLKVPLPPKSLRVMFTTFDSSAQGNLPPSEWVSVCQQMDQVWLMTGKEASVFAAAGVPRSKIQIVKSPHPWINNALLPLPPTEPKGAGRKFRFLCVSMFLPRRRWDTLIEAFLTEFKDAPDAELYLKVNYPSWHPVPSQPQRDLHQLLETLRTQTGSQAEVIVDESLDTRLGICRLMDSCDAYVSTDTSITAPVGEAFVRKKIVVIPDGYGIALPYCEGALIIPTDPKLTRPLTEAMLAYQPYHRGKQMPLLRVEDVRQTLRAAYQLPEAERLQKGLLASQVMECEYGPANVTANFINAISTGLREKFPATPPAAARVPDHNGRIKVCWEGSFLDFGSLSHVNRELTRALADSETVRLQCVNAPALPEAAHVPKELKHLADSLAKTAPADTQFTIRHAWPPNWQRPAQGKLVVIQPWEFGSLPQAWVEQAKQVDEFWVPTNYVRQVYVESGIPGAKVHVVPNGIDPERFRPQAPPRILGTNKTFKFLFVGGTIPRKGTDILLAAFLKAFTGADDVALVIKDFGGSTFYKGQTMSAHIAEAQRRPHAPEIIYLDAEFAPEELPGLYTACNCLVHPYRGEGFGLPALEAMACSLPVIVTGGGATDDFATDEFAYRIPARRHGLGHEISGMKLAGEAWLLEPDVNALVDRMKWVAAHREAAAGIGQKAGEHVRSIWTWKNAAQAAAARLRHIANTKSFPGPTKSTAAPDTAAPVAQRGSLKTAPAPERELPFVARTGNLDAARALFGRRDFAGAWNVAVAAVQVRPFHPEAFLLLAEIALLAGDAQRARKCAEHARTLAPNWSAPKQFLKKPLKGDARLDWLLPDSIFLAVKSPRLTVCVIARNEEKFLAQCLGSIRGLAQQIIVVDTGSIDRTVEIAREQGAEVHSFDWCDDFGAARNAALEHATGDWILMLDADEELSSEQHVRLVQDSKNPGTIALRLPLVNRGQEAEGQSYVPRFFRNAPGVHFQGRIHEQVFPSLVSLAKSWGLKTAFGSAQITHHGYSADMVKDRNKIERNLHLLQLAVAENAGDANLVMNLGLELVRSGDLACGLTRYREAFRLLSAQNPTEVVPELREALLTQFSSHLYKIRWHEEVVRMLTSPLAKNGGLTASLHFALGLSNFELKNYRQASEQMRQCLAKRNQPALSPINTDILTAAPHHCLALSLARDGDLAGAEAAFQAAAQETGRVEDVKLDYAKFLAAQNRQVDALHALHEVVSQNAGHAAAWRLGGEIGLSRPEFLEFANDWSREAMRFVTEDLVIVEQRAEVLLLNGDLASARELWERICRTENQPRALAALILCEALAADTTHAPTDPAQEATVSREFVVWYQKLVLRQSNAVVTRLNARTEKFARALPTAAGMIEKALFEVKNSQTPPASGPSPDARITLERENRACALR